jgi:uncharacterized protein (DUF305 family)
MRHIRGSARVTSIWLTVVAAALCQAAFADDETPLYAEADVRFLQHMIVHHQQAIDMAALVQGRTTREALIRYASYVARSQHAEIAMMQSLLELAAERGLDVPSPHALHGDPPMRGMLSAAQIEALAAASGAGFERLWLEGMIHHHEGAVGMARAQQLEQLRDGRRPYVLDVLVEDIIEDQRAEIGTMRRLLAEWGLE